MVQFRESRTSLKTWLDKHGISLDAMRREKTSISQIEISDPISEVNRIVERHVAEHGAAPSIIVKQPWKEDHS